MVPAFVIRNLSAFYGVREVLRDLSVDIPSQCITALIGPSGCGKSTFLKLLNRIAETEAALRITGQVNFLGQNLYEQAVNVTKLRQTVGMVFQQPTPFAMSIYDNIAVPARLVGALDLPHLVETSLRKAALWDEVKTCLRSPALTLSGGQQQRLCIARALAVRPKVLLLDEPCSALDPVATARIEVVLQALKQELTLIIVTHNPAQAQRLGDHILTFGLDQQQCGYLVSAAFSQPVTR